MHSQLYLWARIFLMSFLCALTGKYEAQSQESFINPQIKRGIWKGDNIEYIDAQISVKLRSMELVQTVKNVIQGYGGVFIQDFDKLKWALIQLPSGRNIFPIIDSLFQNQLIEVAEPNIIGHIYSDPNDSLYQIGYQWPLYNYGQAPFYGDSGADINIRAAWDITRGDSNIIISVLDTGIPLSDTINNQLNHPDLMGSSRIILGRDYVFGILQEETDSSVRDFAGHGTFVTGILGAETNNSIYMAGIAGNCKVLINQAISKLLNVSSVSFKNAVIASVDRGAKIINFSGGFETDNQILLDGVKYADSLGVLIVAAVGNDNSSVGYPARYSLDYSNVIAVTATLPNDNIASYPNLGPAISVAAPGGDDCGSTHQNCVVYSLWPTYLNPSGRWGGYGTSYAAPHVSGVAGLILSIRPNLTPEQVRTILENTADDKGAPGLDTIYGYGRINAGRALHYIYDPPEDLTISQIKIGSIFRPHLSWRSKPDYCVDHYNIYRSSPDTNSFTKIGYVDHPETTFTDNDCVIDANSGNNKMKLYYCVKAELASDETQHSNIVNIDAKMCAEHEEKSIADKKPMPDVFSLTENYPDPFNPSTKIKYGLPEDAFITLKVYDILGREVATLVNEFKVAGWYEIEFDANNIPSGMYFYKIQATQIRYDAGSPTKRYINVKKMVLLK